MAPRGAKYLYEVIADSIRNASLGLEYHGYTATETVLARDPSSTWPNLRTTHPEVFEIVVRDATTDSVERRVSFRLPPCRNEQAAVRNHHAAAAAVDHVLSDVSELEVVCMRGSDAGSDFAVVESERLDAVQQASDEFRIFGTETFLERDPLPVGLVNYSPEDAIDHERQFGVPEPDGTLKIEQLPAAQQYIDSGSDD